LQRNLHLKKNLQLKECQRRMMLGRDREKFRVEFAEEGWVPWGFLLWLLAACLTVTFSKLSVLPVFLYWPSTFNFSVSELIEIWLHDEVGLKNNL
jgi:hypothetical protein